MKKKRLGRGLSGLIRPTEPSQDEDTPATPPPDRMPAAPSAQASSPAPAAEPATASDGPGARTVPIHQIRTNPYQPREVFDDAGLEDLERSIREHGVLQPLVVRRGGHGYELIAGERRLRASKAAGLEEVPVVLRDATDEEMQTLALVENVQREDLGAIEKAKALRAMMRNFGFTQEQVAAKVGKARTTIANLVRLLDLPDVIQAMVERRELSGAQARAILQAKGTERRLALAQEAFKKGLSVREIEKRAKAGPTIGKRRTAKPDPYVRDLEERLTRALSTRVSLGGGRESGTIAIHWHGQAEFERLLEMLEG